MIVGGGHNGLVCAAYLAHAGLRTAVLERRHLVGGAAVTEEPWPGYRVSTASYVVSLLPQRIVRELDLPRFGYHVCPLDPEYFAPSRTAAGSWCGTTRARQSVGLGGAKLSAPPRAGRPP